MRQPQTPDQRATAVAARQHAAINRNQARGAGLTDRQIDTRLARGIWCLRVRNVFVIAGSPDTWERRAWVAYLATSSADGVLSHATAAALYGLMPPSPLPHVTVPVAASARCRAAKIHRSAVPIADRQHRDGLTVTSPSRLLVDMAGALALPNLEELTDDVLCRKLATAGTVFASAERAGRGRHGSTVLRAVLEVWSEGIKPGSPAEVRLLRLLGELGLRRLVTQFKVVDESGAFVALLDVAEPDLHKGLEYDSERFHGPRQWQRDEPRYQRLAALGWEVDGVTKADLVPGERRLHDIANRWLKDTRAA